MSEEGATHSGNNSVNLREFRKQKKPSLSHKENGTSTESPKRFQRIRVNLTSESDSDDNSVSRPASAKSAGGGRPAPSKNPVVLEKERQMRFLLEHFPKTDAMEIHNLLSKFLFDTDLAAQALSEKLGVPAYQGGYTQWKLDQKLPDFQKETPPKSPENGSVTVSNKRKAPAVFGNNTKKKVKRSRVENRDSDDSSGGSAAGDFRDSRVYNSSDEDSDVEISDVLTPEKRNVLDFFQNATPKELELMMSCSKKKAEAIIEYRPFKGWIDLVQKLQENKNLSTDLLNAAHQVIITRNNIRQLMKKCGSLGQQMERAVAVGGGVIQQPRILISDMKLTSYQMVGLNWLAVLHNQGVNGILADEMGLGKTVQVIAFLAHLKETGRAKNIHVVVVPSSTLDNWRVEFARWCPSLRVFMYYGSTEERRQYRIDLSKGGFAEYDVLLTTYTMVGNTSEEKKMFRVTPIHYVVFDEAHMLKNMNTQRYENLMRIHAANRILLTGTPLQNNLLELMSLLIFVMPKMFAEKAEDLKSLFQKTSKSKAAEQDDIPAFEKEQIEQAKRIMKPFVLRRLKQDVLQDLPKKTDCVIHVPMAPTQREQYEQLVNTFQSASKNSENPSSYNGMAMMTDLRKLSNHPLLLRYHYQLEDVQEMAKLLAGDPAYKDTKAEYIVDDLLYMSDFEIHTMTKQYSSIQHFQLPDNLILTSGKFIYLDKKLEELKQGGHRVLIFSQYVILLNVLEEYMKIRKHSYLRLDGSTPVNTRQQLIDEYTEDDSIFIFLLSTRAGGLGINLTSADTVIINDIDFNPYNDKQAEDRCHRMGQQNPVQVFRLISQGTIEEGMLQMNKEKLKLERDITTEGKRVLVTIHDEWNLRNCKKLIAEGENPDVKSVVRLLSSVLGIDANKVTNLVSPNKKKT